MVLAMALDLDLPQHDHVVVALHVLEHPRQLLGRIGLVAVEPLAVGVDHAARRVEQAFTVGVVTGPGDQGAHCLQGLLPGRAFGGRGTVGNVRRGIDQLPWLGQSIHVGEFPGLSCARATALE